MRNDRTYRAKLSASVSYCDDDFEQKIYAAKRLKFDCLDFDLCKHWENPALQAELYPVIENRLETLVLSGVKLNGIHISFGEMWDVSVTDESERKANIKRVKEIMARTREFAPFCYIFHGSFETITAENRRSRLAEMRNSVLELADSGGAVFCLENLPRNNLLNTAEETLENIKYLNEKNENVRLCADVNHFVGCKSEYAVALLIDYIATMHISDYDYVDEKHWLPGQGNIDWEKLIGVLKEADYRGAFNYEVSNTLEEIRENYDMLFCKYGD